MDGKSYVPKGNGKSTLHKQPPLQDKGPTTSESRLRSTRRSRSGYSRTGTGISGQIHDNRMVSGYSRTGTGLSGQIHDNRMVSGYSRTGTGLSGQIHDNRMVSGYSRTGTGLSGRYTTTGW